MRGINEALAGLPPAEAGGSTVLLRVCQVLVPLRTPVRGLDGFRSMGAGAHGFRLGCDLEPKLKAARTAEFSKTGASRAGGDSAREGTRNIAPTPGRAYG